MHRKARLQISCDTRIEKVQGNSASTNEIHYLIYTIATFQ